MTARLGGSGARAVLAGTGRHDPGSVLPPVPAVEETVTALRDALVGCGLRPGNITTLVDPAGPEPFLDAVIAAADDATDVLLVYYVGHGALSPDGALHLATRATVDLTKKAAYQALPFSEIHGVLMSCRARTVVVVLDCCFSGRAVNPVPSGALLASADRDEHALAPDGERYTAFSGELLAALNDGIPTAPGELRLQHVFDHLHRRIVRRGGPAPVLRIGNNAAELVLAPNRAYRPVTDPASGEQPGEGACPYRGLEPYTVEDEVLFAGRAALVEAVLRRLREGLSTGGLVVVSGPSGSGKSSLLAAGLIPAVRRGELGALATPPPQHILFTPGDDPLGALATALADWCSQDPAVVRAALPEAIARARNAAVLIVVDQFEELFTSAATEPERREFVAALDAAAAPGHPAATVVLGVRSDFIGHCAGFGALVSALESRTVVVGPMTTGELREAITEPAARTGYAPQPGLVEILLRDAGADPADANATGYHPGVLPLLSQALLRTWQGRTGATLTVDGYRAAGGVTGAVAATAEEVFGALAPQARDVARGLLLRMVRAGGDGPDTRRRLRRSDVAGPEARAVLAAFAEARLVTLDGPDVEITHEALIRSWPRLRSWMATDRAGRRAVQDLEVAAEQWRDAGEEAGRLYRGGRLAEARALLGTVPEQEISAAGREFLAASLRQRRRGARMRRILAGVLAVLTVVASTAAVLAIVRGDRLDRQLRAANAQSLAAASEAEAPGRPAFAARLALAAWRAEQSSPAARNALARRYLQLRSVDHVFDDLARRPITQLRSSGDGRMTMLLDDQGVTMVTGLLSGPVSTWRIPGADLRAALSADGRWLVTARTGKPIELWDLRGRTGPLPLAGSPEVTWTHGIHLAFASDGSRLLAAGGNDAFLWAVASRTRMPLPARPFGAPGLSGVEFTEDPDLVLVSHPSTELSEPDTLETRSLTDGRRVRGFPAGAVAAGRGRWVVTCVTASPGAAGGPLLTLRSAATGQPARRLWDPNCALAPIAGGDYLVPSATSSPSPGRQRVVSAATGAAYDLVLPPAADALRPVGADVPVEVIDRGGAPVALMAVGTTVLRLADVVRDWLPRPGDASPIGDGNQLVFRTTDTVEVLDRSSGRRLGRLVKDRAVRYNGSGWPLGFARKGVYWQVTDFVMPELTRNHDYPLPGADPGADLLIGSLAVTTVGATTMAAMVKDQLSTWNTVTGRMIAGPIAMSSTEEQRLRFVMDGGLVERPGHPDEFAVFAAGEPIQLWSAAQGKRLRTLAVTAGSEDIAFDDTGDRVVTRQAGAIEVWDVGTGRRIGEPITAPDVDALLGITADGYVVTGKAEVVSLWDPRRRVVSGTLDFGSGEAPVTLHGADRLAVDGTDLMPSVVPLSATTWFGELCRAFGTGFTAPERAALPDGADDVNPCTER
ncbi:caspase family protein [Actinoplanes oblitus]|uniref:Caspase family protein n=1 Tax=Actinoplanes oblitus TaxID=3040509 RepID=A0ABY8W887_9ACTN|nr:AAA family ATPase [Actinoplanes oblitus]WIM94056.1 caspase family protein [Actinoplanes oblitus]